MTCERSIRASDQDRESVAEVLRDAFAEGCLDRGELEQRSSGVYRARTLGDLADLTADLPGWLFDRFVAPPREYRCVRPPRSWPLGFIGAVTGFWLIAVAMAWAPLAAVPLVVVWLLVMVRPLGRVPRSARRRPGRGGGSDRLERPPGQGVVDPESGGHAGQFQHPADDPARPADDGLLVFWQGAAGGGEYPHRRAIDEGDVGEVQDEPFRPLLQYFRQRALKRVPVADVEFTTDDNRGRGATEERAYGHVLRE
jgi:hypothetical protein